MTSASTHHIRPPVSVVMPFAGNERDAMRALETLCSIECSAGDELILADNSATFVMEQIAARRPEVKVVRAGAQRSSYYARNVAAAGEAED